MKKLRYIFLSLVILFTSFSCEDELDINTNPLAASSADPNAVLPFVFVQYSARKMSELGTRIQDVPQHMNFNFNSPRGGATTSFLTGNTWDMYYTQMLGNLELVRLDALEAGPTSNNVAAIAIVMEALAFYELTSIWEDIPFTQALNGSEFQNPEFDTQETVLRGVVDMLNEAVDLINNMPAEGNMNVAVGDMLYEGDMSKWEKFANSLKLRVLMMIRNADPASVEAEIASTLNSPLIEDVDDVAMIRYPGGPGAKNAIHNIVESFIAPTNEAGKLHAPSEVIVDLIQDNNDPREDIWFFNEGGVAAPIGKWALFVGNSIAYNNNVVREDFPDVLLTPAEIHLYRAELALKGVSAAGDAQEQFEEGVKDALTFYGQTIPGASLTLSDGEINAFVASLPQLSTLSLFSPQEALEKVYEQLYLEAFLRPILAWNQVRRNDYPNLEEVPGATISTYLKRFTYPPDEIAANPNTPPSKITDVPMWFEN